MYHFYVRRLWPEIDAVRVVTNDPTHNFSFARVREAAYAGRRRGVWNDQQMIALQLTPAARVRLAQLNKKYWSFMFVGPGACWDLVLTRIDLQ